MRVNKYFLQLILILVTAGSALTASAEIDKKYYKKVAEKVWGAEMPGFDPDADLTDSIFQGQNAAYIARYIGLTAVYDNDLNPTKQRIIGLSNSNITKATLLRRTMVKINDAAAAEDFTEFSVNPEIKTDYRGHVFVSIRPAFGARIIKPDGSIKEVDLNEVLTKKTGKKNKKDAQHKIAIAGLEAGDVLDFFYQTEYLLDESNLPEIPVSILGKYPTHLFTLDIKVDPRLNMEYGSYNGAPRITTFDRTEDGKNLLFLQLKDVFSLDESIPYFSTARQMPMMEIYVINPNQPYFSYTPKMSRPGGMRIANPAFVLRDMGFSIVDSKINDKIVGEAHSITKNWKKAHPDATDQQTADAAWIALNYAAIKEDEDLSNRQISKMFYKVLEKMDSFTDARIIATTSRSNVSIQDIANFNDAHFGVMVNDRLYFPTSRVYILPGEMPENLDGENYILFSARPDNPNLYQSVQYKQFPAVKPIVNTNKIVTTASIDPGNPDKVLVASEYTLTGTEKRLFSNAVTFRNFIDETEKFLGVKPAKIKNAPDEVEDSEDAREYIEELAKVFWGSDEARVNEWTLVQPGLTPDKPELIVKLDGSVSDIVSQAGNNLMIKVGSLIGKQDEVTGDSRKRDVSVLMHAPHRVDQTIIFEIPDGYELVEESLNDLNTSVNTVVGAFNTGASVDDGKVKIRMTERYTRSIYPESAWPEVLKIMDASAAFNNASILLRPKK